MTGLYSDPTARLASFKPHHHPWSKTHQVSGPWISTQCLHRSTGELWTILLSTDPLWHCPVLSNGQRPKTYWFSFVPRPMLRTRCGLVMFCQGCLDCFDCDLAAVSRTSSIFQYLPSRELCKDGCLLQFHDDPQGLRRKIVISCNVTLQTGENLAHTQ